MAYLHVTQPVLTLLRCDFPLGPNDTGEDLFISRTSFQRLIDDQAGLYGNVPITS